MQFIRMIFVLLAFEVIFYVMISAYIRSMRVEALENEWKSRYPARAHDRDAMDTFARRGMIGYRKTLKARLVAFVFVIPTIIVLTIIWGVNAQ